MMKKLLLTKINNNNKNITKKNIILLLNNEHYNFHFEIIESVIVKYKEIINIKENNLKIFITCCENTAFINYIKNKYSNVFFDKCINFDYCINITTYDNDYSKIIKNSNKIFYILHEITERLTKLSNCVFLSPLSNKKYLITDILPFMNEKKKSNIPIFIIQGNFCKARRNINLLIRILENEYIYNFKFKIIGRVKNLPEELIKYSDKIIIKNNLNFIDYHKEFLNGYCILPLITKKTHEHYYKNKLTSTINYALGYKLKCLIDNDLQCIYKLKDVEIFNDENDIVTAFTNVLSMFYNKN